MRPTPVTTPLIHDAARGGPLFCGGLFALVAVILALCVPAHPALACSPDAPTVYTLKIADQFGPVPTQSAIFLEIRTLEDGSYFAPRVDLRISGGEEPIPLVIEEVEVGAYTLQWFARPAGGFAPETDYDLTVFYDETESSFVFKTTTFRTSAGPDLDAPDAHPPLVLDADFTRAHARGPCGGSDAYTRVSAELERAWDLGGDLIEYELGREADLSDAVGGYILGGDGLPADDLDLGRAEKVYARVRVVDLSGNVGPWTEIASTRILLCAVAEDGPTGAISLLLMALAGLIGGRPRRRQTRG